MAYASIEREIHIDAPPEVVFDVVSQPEHIKQWRGAETEIGPVAGSSSALVWPGGGETDQHTAGVPIQIVAAEPPRVLTFRWTHPAAYRDHETSWDHLVPRIREYAESLIRR